MSRRLIVLPVDFDGPWSPGFSGPLPVSESGTFPPTHQVVFTVDFAGEIPASARSVDLTPGCTLAAGLARAGVRRCELSPSPRLKVPVAATKPAKLSLFKRIKNFFRRFNHKQLIP